MIDSLKIRIRREKDRNITSDRSSSSAGTIQNIKSEKAIHLPRVFSIKEDAPMDVSVSSTGSDIKRRLQASLKIYPPESSSVNQSSEIYHPQQVQNCVQEPQISSQPPPISSWVNRAPHLAHVMASYKPEETTKPHLPTFSFPPLFANPYMGQFSIPTTAVPSSVSTPTGVRTPSQQPVNWQIPQPVLFGLAAYTNHPKN